MTLIEACNAVARNLMPAEVFADFLEDIGDQRSGWPRYLIGYGPDQRRRLLNLFPEWTDGGTAYVDGDRVIVIE